MASNSENDFGGRTSSKSSLQSRLQMLSGLSDSQNCGTTGGFKDALWSPVVCMTYVCEQFRDEISRQTIAQLPLCRLSSGDAMRRIEKSIERHGRARWQPPISLHNSEVGSRERKYLVPSNSCRRILQCTSDGGMQNNLGGDGSHFQHGRRGVDGKTRTRQPVASQDISLRAISRDSRLLYTVSGNSRTTRRRK